MPNDGDNKDSIEPVTTYRGRSLAFDIINRVTMGGGYTNILTRHLSDNAEITDGDRGAAVNLVYGVLRNIFLLDEILRSKSRKGKLALSPKLLNSGRMAVYEIVFMPAIPQYASVSEYINMARKEGSEPECGFLNACLRNIQESDLDLITEKHTDPVERMALRYSHPRWLARMTADQYGVDEARKILTANNNPQPTYFRINASKISQEDILSKSDYTQQGFMPVDSPPNCLALPHGMGQFPVRKYDAGWLTPQDRSTQYISFFLDPGPEDTILDLCCGSGVKTTQIAELTGKPGNITAVDIYRNKLDALEAECSRLGLSGVKTIKADVTEKPDLGSFKKVLLDAPCSGTGTLRRRPEIKLRIIENSIDKMIELQDRLLDAASGYVAPDGVLVYSTCSILRRENEDRIKIFLEKHQDFVPFMPGTDFSLPFSIESFHSTEYGITFIPHKINACGSFASVLRKN